MLVIPLLFNGILFTAGFLLLQNKIHQLENRLDTNFNLLIGKIIELTERVK